VDVHKKSRGKGVLHGAKLIFSCRVVGGYTSRASGAFHFLDHQGPIIF
jgi:hypothetical protein